MIWDVKIEIEAGEITSFESFDFIDVELGKKHSPFRVIGMRKRQEAVRTCPIFQDFLGGKRTEPVP